MSGRHRVGDPYAGIPGRRLFVAVPLPDDAVTEVRQVVESVQRAGLPAGARDVRWVRLDGLHLTLRFLGPTPDALVEPTAEAVRAVAAAIAGPIDVEFGGAGAFPAVGRPRALWLGISGGAQALAALAAAVEEALAEIGWTPVDRPFRPHLTLARSDGIASGTLVAGRLVASMTDRRIRTTIDHLGLFESVTGGGPARYVPVTLAEMGRTPTDTVSVYHQATPDPP